MAARKPPHHSLTEARAASARICATERSRHEGCIPFRPVFSHPEMRPLAMETASPVRRDPTASRGVAPSHKATIGFQSTLPMARSTRDGAIRHRDQGTNHVIYSL